MASQGSCTASQQQAEKENSSNAHGSMASSSTPRDGCGLVGMPDGDEAALGVDNSVSQGAADLGGPEMGRNRTWEWEVEVEAGVDWVEAVAAEQERQMGDAVDRLIMEDLRSYIGVVDDVLVPPPYSQDRGLHGYDERAGEEDAGISDDVGTNAEGDHLDSVAQLLGASLREAGVLLSRRDAAPTQALDDAYVVHTWITNADAAPLDARIEVRNLPWPSAFIPLVRNENDKECSICRSDYKEGEEMAILPCPGLHRFQRDCIIAWHETKWYAIDCPFCRAGLKLTASIALA